MKVFEYMKKSNLMTLEPDQQRFVSKMILREVDKIAKEHDITVEQAYWAYSQGLYDADRELTF